MTIDLVTATADTFRPHVGQSFTVATTAGPVTLVLDNVKVFEGSTIRDNRVEVGGLLHPPRKAFALTFEGPREPVLAPRQMDLTHPTLGHLPLFVSPFRQDHDCTLYEAVFN
jgi:hypothetical protein